jgi:hypothetical protein
MLAEQLSFLGSGTEKDTHFVVPEIFMLDSCTIRVPLLPPPEENVGKDWPGPKSQASSP